MGDLPEIGVNITNVLANKLVKAIFENEISILNLKNLVSTSRARTHIHINNTVLKNTLTCFGTRIGTHFQVPSLIVMVSENKKCPIEQNTEWTQMNLALKLVSRKGSCARSLIAFNIHFLSFINYTQQKTLLLFYFTKDECIIILRKSVQNFTSKFMQIWNNYIFYSDNYLTCREAQT